MPFTEKLTKDGTIFFKNLWRALSGKQPKRILVYPHFPSRGGTIYRIAEKLGYEVTNKPGRGFDVAIFWEYGTYRNEFEVLEKIQAEQKVHIINLHNRNIAKDHVDAQMLEAFGYSTKLDPRTFEGIAVRKSLTNAVHDGTKVECPCEPEAGFIYQKFIDSSVNEHEVMDLRIPIMGDEIPHLYFNYRQNDQRFKNVPDRAELKTDVDQHVSKEEKANLLAFCKLAHLEFGELDVLRDCNDGKLYIVDANNTPQGPPKNLTPQEKVKSVELYAESFKRQFIKS